MESLNTLAYLALYRDIAVSIACHTQWCSVFFLLLFVNGEGSGTLARCAPSRTFRKYVLAAKLCLHVVETKIWDQLSQVKHVVQEGRGADSFADTIDEYYNAVNTGALLLAVCRGKISEGLDFKGEKARAVFVVGIPFPSYQVRDYLCRAMVVCSGDVPARPAHSRRVHFRIQRSSSSGSSMTAHRRV